VGPATSAAQLRGNAAIAATTSHADTVALGDTDTVRHRDTDTHGDGHCDADAICHGDCDADAHGNGDDHDTDLATACTNEDGLSRQAEVRGPNAIPNADTHELTDQHADADDHGQPAATANVHSDAAIRFAATSDTECDAHTERDGNTEPNVLHSARVHDAADSLSVTDQHTDGGCTDDGAAIGVHPRPVAAHGAGPEGGDRWITAG
jgi:hypothetical protein